MKLYLFIETTYCNRRSNTKTEQNRNKNNKQKKVIIKFKKIGLKSVYNL